MVAYKTAYGETINVSIDEAISHFRYGISHDIFKEPVVSYAQLAIIALEKYKKDTKD